MTSDTWHRIQEAIDEAMAQTPDDEVLDVAIHFEEGRVRLVFSRTKKEVV